MDKNKAGHILVIRLSAMGDVAMTVPVLLALTRCYPELRITILTRGFFEPLFAQLDKVRVFRAEVEGKHKGLAGLWKLYRELQGVRFDAIADLHNVLRSNVLKYFFSLSGVPFVQIDKGRAEKRALTAMNNKVFKPLRTTHQRYADVFGKLGWPIALESTNLLNRQPLSDNTRELVGKDHGKWLGLAPFAAYPGKMYPARLMEQLIREISETGRYKIILFGGGESEARQLESWAMEFDNCINIAGKLGFKEELALISNLDLMVSMDSANAHLAANYAVPTITLWGLTHPYAGFYPFRQDPGNALLSDRDQYPGLPTSVYGNKMPAGYERVMETIAPAKVLAKIQALTGT